MMASSCENPQPPNWTWRYNRDKHLSRFEPWYTRVDQWHPRYRHMGVPYNFRFHPISGAEAICSGEAMPLQQIGLSYAKHLRENRETGFGNAGLGNPPGPAPPRLAMYMTENCHPVPELYRVNEIDGITGGMSLWDYSRLDATMPDSSSPPLDPSQYLQETLGQTMEYPGTFPHYNCHPPPSGDRSCLKGQPTMSPLDLWTARHRSHLRGHALERMCASRRFLPPLESGPTPSRAQYAQRAAASGCC